MSLLSSFISNQIIKGFEAELLEHEPELQDAFIHEVALAVNVVVDWVNEKIKNKQNKTGAN